MTKAHGQDITRKTNALYSHWLKTCLLYTSKAMVNGKELLVGNFKLMDKFSIAHEVDSSSIVYTIIAIAYDKKFVGYVTIADIIKEDAQLTIDRLKALGVKTTMLSGDKSNVVQFVAKSLGIINAYGDLLPEDKVNKVKEIKAQNETVAFVGDGVKMCIRDRVEGE